MQVSSAWWMGVFANPLLLSIRVQMVETATARARNGSSSFRVSRLGASLTRNRHSHCPLNLLLRFTNPARRLICHLQSNRHQYHLPLCHRPVQISRSRRTVFVPVSLIRRSLTLGQGPKGQLALKRSLRKKQTGTGNSQLRIIRPTCTEDRHASSHDRE